MLSLAGAGVALAALLASTPAAIAADPSDTAPTGPAADTIRFTAHEMDRAPLDLAAGDIDIYLNGVAPDAMQALATTPGITLTTTPSVLVDLLLNPAPAPEGQLNPFSIPEVRQAMHGLVDRELIARDIYRGYARPQVSVVSSALGDYLTAYDVIRGSGVAYDPEHARHAIATAMTAAGATLVDGRWAYAGKPIELRFIARVEDARRRIGDVVRAELERAGFTVTMRYLSYAPASDTVYATDPSDLGWHIYTESWVLGGSSRWSTVSLHQFAAPWWGNMPGWGKPGYWQYEDPALDDVSRALYRGEFDSRASRDDLVRRLVRSDLDASVRIWLATVEAGYPASDQLTGMTTDVITGARSAIALRTAHIPGRTDLNVGVQTVWNESSTWSPLGGLSDAYSGLIYRMVTDQALTSDPWSARQVPYRAGFSVETAGPDGTLPVPADAVTWDPVGDAWVPVPAGTTATSAVTYDYTKFVGAPWHDGSPITLADAAYVIAQSFEIVGDPVKSQVEPTLGSQSKPKLDTIRGYRFLDDHRIVVYVDYWHFDEGEIASYASPAGFGWPWQLLAATDALVFDRRAAAYTRTTATGSKVPWLSLVLARDAALVDGVLADMEAGDPVPPGVFEIGGRSLVTPDEARARIAATRAYFASHRHLVDTSGPYDLTRFDTTAQYAELTAIRDPAYPMRATDLAREGRPEVAIGRVVAPTVTMGSTVAIEVPVAAPGTIELRWVLMDPATMLPVAVGEGEPGATPGTMTVTIGADVTVASFPGPYQLYVAATSDKLAAVAERRIDLDIEP